MSTSRNSSSLTSVLKGPIREDINEYKQRNNVYFKKFLGAMLNQCAIDPSQNPDSILEEVLDFTTNLYNDSRFDEARTHLKRYCREKTTEKEGYPDLVKFVNEAFTLLREGTFDNVRGLSELSDVVIHENDPTRITATYENEPLITTSVSPDLIFVTQRLRDAKIAEAPSQKDSEKNKYYWTETMGTMEVKLMAEKALNDPPFPYNRLSELKEYHRLHDITLPKGKCASEVYAVKDGDSALDYVPGNRSMFKTSAYEDGATGEKRKSSRSCSFPVEQAKKRREEEERLKPNEQVTIYSGNMLSRGVYSLHAINLLVADDLVWAWWFDRQNVIQTSALNFVKDVPYFLALLVAFQRFTLSDWGVEPSLVSPKMFIELGPPETTVDIDFGADLVSKKEKLVVRITIPSPRDPSPLRGIVLKGRGTCVIPAQSTTETFKAKMVVKASWPETDRNNEMDVILTAVDAMKKANPVLVDSLPKLFGSKDVELSKTDRINGMLDLEPAPESCSARVLRLLVFQQLQPLEDVTVEQQFIDAWTHCFQCHYALWKMGIQHGDISVWNMMWEGDKHRGVLNDFDLAVVKNSGKRGTERTGTLPFMARAMLKGTFYTRNRERLYIHEVECFIWVLVWLTLRKVPLPSECEWRRNHDGHAILGAKNNFVNSEFNDFNKDMENIRYTHTWGKCKIFMALLKKFDDFEGAKIKVDETVAQKIHDEVLKIMTSANYSIERKGDLDKFYYDL